MRFCGVKLVNVLARDRCHLQQPEFGPKVALHDTLHRKLGGPLVLSFDVLGDVTVEKVIHRRRRPESLPLARRIATVDRHRL
jgi:hypothetical protein